jgi:hypothetical protein
MYIHGIQVPSQVSENIPDNVELSNGNNNNSNNRDRFYEK